MANVDIFQASRMKQIEDTTVVSGLVNPSGNLLLRTRAGAEIDAGPVRGAPGAPGVAGANGAAGDPAVPAGTISLWVADVAPLNWMICDGSAISRSEYASLFSAIGTKYGAGDGVNTFNLPNLQSRTPIGYDVSQVEFNALGKTGGSKTHLLTALQTGVRPHTHSMHPQYKLANGTNAQSGNAIQGGEPSTTYPNHAQYGGMAPTTTTPAAAADAAEAHNILQPYTVVHFIIKVSAGQSPGDSELATRVGALETHHSATPAGTVTMWTGDAAPTNWFLCDGAAVSRTTYASLFAAVGVKYGPGDGSTTFNLPNLKGRVPVGRDASQTEFDVLGETGGAKTHTLTVAEMPSHNHETLINVATLNARTAGNNSYNVDNAGTHGTANRGGNAPHNNLQPYLVVHYIIKFTNGDTKADSQLTQRVSVLETNNASKWKMTGTVSSLWTTGNPKVTLSDNVVVTARIGSRTPRLRPGDEVLCENVGGTWYILEVSKANGPEWTNFIPLPIVNNYFRPWYQDSTWTIRGDEGYFRDMDPTVAFWLTKNSSGVVTIQGLCGSGGVPATTTFAILPEGFRPSTIRLFPATCNETRIHVEIHPDGRMLFPGFAVPADSWVTLGNVIFHDAAQDLNWIAPTTFYNGFGLHPSNASYPIGYAIDAFGWMWFRGIVSVGTPADMNAMFEVPKAHMPKWTFHLAAASNTNTGYLSVRHNQTVGYLDYRAAGGAPAWISADGIMYPPSALANTLPFNGPGDGIPARFGQLSFMNSWVNYDVTFYPPLLFTKRTDGLVWWQGLIKTGVVGANAAYIPRGYRTLVRHATEKIANIAHARLSFDPTDRVISPEVGSNAWYSVDASVYQAAR